MNEISNDEKQTRTSNGQNEQGQAQDVDGIGTPEASEQPCGCKEKTMAEYYVYGLKDSHKKLNGIRYIGVTQSPIVRLCTHIMDGLKSKPSTKKELWIRLVINCGRTIKMEIIAGPLTLNHAIGLEKKLIQSNRETLTNIIHTKPLGSMRLSKNGKIIRRPKIIEGSTIWIELPEGIGSKKTQSWTFLNGAPASDSVASEQQPNH